MAHKRGELSTGSEKTTLSSFTILTLALPTLPSFPNPANHYLYIRPDTPKNPTADTPRSIFVANVPIDASESSMRALFKQISGARVSHVVFEGEETRTSGPTVAGEAWGVGESMNGKKRKLNQLEDTELSRDDFALPSTWTLKLKKSGSSAVVVFVDRTTAESVMKESRRMYKRGEKLKWDPVEPLGEDRYIEHHALTYPPKSVLQQSVNAYLTRYSQMEEARARRLKQLRSEPDDEGFVTVTHGGRNAPAKLETAQAAAERLKERAKKRSVGNMFYRFQAREEAKRKERELRKKFEDDARKLKDMRARRGRIKPE